jgi:hypothetical protein
MLDGRAWSGETVRYFLSLCSGLRQELTPKDVEILTRKFAQQGKHFPY